MVMGLKTDLFLVYTTPTKDIRWSGKLKDLNLHPVYLIDLEEVNIQKAILVPPHIHIGKPFDVKELKTAMDLVLDMMSELKEERERYRNLFKYTGRCVAVYEAIDNGKDFVFKDFNPAAEHAEQVKKEDVLGRRVTEVFPGVKNFGLLDVFRRVYKTGQPEHFPMAHYKDERISGWRDNFVYKLPTGEIVAVYEDLTEYKQLKEEIKKKEELYRSIFENTGTATVIIDEDSTVLLANKESEKLSGYSKKELEGEKTWEDFVVEEDLKRMKKYHDLRRKDPSLAPRKYTFRLRDRQGNIKHIQVNVGMIPRTKKSVASLIDITELKEAKRRIEESEERYRAVVETAPNGIIVLDKNGRILEVNKKALKLSGFKREDLIGKNIIRILPKIKLDPEEIISGLKLAIKGEKPDKKVRTFTNLKGEKISFIEHHSVLEKNGEVVGLSVIIEDVTERCKAEKKIKESLKEKETLLREIHHRVKNNLQIISSLLNLQFNKIKGEEVHRLLKESQGRIQAMTMIHEHLYQSETLTHINFKEYTKRIIDNIFLSYKAKIKKKLEIQDIKLDIDTAIPLGLIINELITNSIKYAFPTGEGTITIKLTTNDDNIELIVADDGIGLPESIDLEKTETLGLKLVNILTKQIDGKITLKTGQGTQFKIIFKDKPRKR
ncbi:MAG: PAS domain S-box protein [Methanobacteriales archaeon]|nr:PAS domain S-box protein [Methanobacteriaceae archaeon]MBC7096984.1 PAS domain S-box protein [Methanobacteriales archaeon]